MQTEEILYATTSEFDVAVRSKFGLIAGNGIVLFVQE